MKKTKTVSSGWLFGPQPTKEHIEIVKLGWYYLGASDHPELIKVLDIKGDMFTYIKQIDFMHQTGKPSRIETRIGQDLISMANRTMRKHAESYRKQAETLDYMRGHAEQVEGVISRHDLDEETKQYMDMRQAEAEVYPRDTDAHGRLSNWEYMIEDAMRERAQIERRNNDYWWEFDTAYPAFDTVVTESETRSMVYTVYVYDAPKGNSVTDQYLLTEDNYVRRFSDITSARQVGQAAVKPGCRYLIQGTDMVIGGARYSEEFTAPIPKTPDSKIRANIDWMMQSAREVLDSGFDSAFVVNGAISRLMVCKGLYMALVCMSDTDPMPGFTDECNTLVMEPQYILHPELK